MTNQELAVTIDNEYGRNYLEDMAMNYNGFVYLSTYCGDLAIQLTDKGQRFVDNLVLSDEERCEYNAYGEWPHDYELAEMFCNEMVNLGLASKVYYSVPEMYD